MASVIDLAASPCSSAGSRSGSRGRRLSVHREDGATPWPRTHPAGCPEARAGATASAAVTWTRATDLKVGDLPHSSRWTEHQFANSTKAPPPQLRRRGPWSSRDSRTPGRPVSEITPVERAMRAGASHRRCGPLRSSRRQAWSPAAPRAGDARTHPPTSPVPRTSRPSQPMGWPRRPGGVIRISGI